MEEVLNRTKLVPVTAGRAGGFWAGMDVGSNSQNRMPKKQIPRFARDDNVGRFSRWRLNIGSTPRFYLTNFVEALAEALLEALVGGLVVGAVGAIVGEAGHVGDFIIEVVGVFVALAGADVFHETGDGVADVERHRFGFGFLNVVDDLAVGSVNGIGFWRERE